MCVCLFVCVGGDAGIPGYISRQKESLVQMCICIRYHGVFLNTVCSSAWLEYNRQGWYKDPCLERRDVNR